MPYFSSRKVVQPREKKYTINYFYQIKKNYTPFRGEKKKEIQSKVENRL